jgi:hypothetical protein
MLLIIIIINMMKEAYSSDRRLAVDVHRSPLLRLVWLVAN